MKALIALVGLFSVPAWANNNTEDFYRQYPVLECPRVGEEYEKMISKLKTVKASVKLTANCRAITTQVKSLEDLVIKDRKEAVAIAEQGLQGSLTEEQAMKVRQYAENVTKKVAALNDLFLNNNQCFSDDEPDKQLNTLAGFVGEASQLVGSLAGPWGAPVTLAGNVVAGFLTALDQTLKSRAGFDFNKPDQWTSYVQNLCTYHSFRDQIEHLLNPEAKLIQLQELKRQLDGQIKVMTQVCAECRSIENAFISQPMKTSTALKALLSHEVTVADGSFDKPYGTYTLQNLGLRDWTLKEMDRVEKEVKSYWSDVSGRHILYRAKEEIEQFLLRREAPRFLNYQVKQSRKNFLNFEMQASGDGKALYSQILKSYPEILSYKVKSSIFSATNPLEYFRALIVHPPKFSSIAKDDETAEDIQFAWKHYREQNLLLLRTVQTSSQVAQSFCSFFKNSDQYSPQIREACTSYPFKELLVKQSQAMDEMSQKARAPLAEQSSQDRPEEDSSPYSVNKLQALSRAIKDRGLNLNQQM